MMNYAHRIVALGLLVVASVGPVALAQPPAATTPTKDLAPRYIDSIHGFSLRPPAGAQIKREPSVTTMVTFSLPDPRTGAARIWMQMSEVMEHRSDTEDLAAYAQALADRLTKMEGFAVDTGKLAVTTVAGKRAIALQGALGSRTKTFHHQVWIETSPRTFLLFSANGPLDAGEEVLKLSAASLATMEIFDPSEFRKKREQDLAAGSKVLEALTPETLAKALAPRDYVLAIVKDNKTIGFVHFREEAARRENVDGVLVVQQMAVAVPGSPEVLTKRSMFAAADRKIEKWDTFAVTNQAAKPLGPAQPGAAAGAENISRQFGMKQDDLLVLQNVVSPTQTKDHTKKLPAGIYVPQAIEPLLGRLIDRTKAGSYAWAVYNASTDGIEMRTLTVVGPENLTIAGRAFPAVHLTDQLMADAPPAQVWLDATGLPLKIVSEDGTTLQATTPEAIQRLFPQQWQRLQALGQ